MNTIRYWWFLLMCWTGYYKWDANEVRLWCFKNGIGERDANP